MVWRQFWNVGLARKGEILMSAEFRFKQRSPFFDERLILAVLLAFTAPITAQQVNAQGSERSGKEVVEMVCTSCHGTGAQGAPKIGDKAAWSKRASQGLTSLTEHALKGIRQMPAHGGNLKITDLEVGRAVTYMVNRSGGRWVEPVSVKDMTAERSGEQVVKAQCAKCHQGGAGGAPKIGDKNAWVPRMKQGIDNLVRSAIRGHGGMPSRGGLADLTDAEIKNAVTYMFNPVAAPASAPREARAAKATAGRSATAGANHMTVDGMDIYLGFAPAESLRGYPAESVERTMHGGVPAGPGYYHVNISLLDHVRDAPITGAQVEIQVEELGLSSETKAMEPMAIGAASYGNYLRVKKKTPYVITVRVRTPGSSRTSEARFQHRFD
jgi:cytochrome c5